MVQDAGAVKEEGGGVVGVAEGGDGRVDEEDGGVWLSNVFEKVFEDLEVDFS